MIELFKKLLMSDNPVESLLEYDQKYPVIETALPIMETLKGVEIKSGIAHKDNYSHSLEVLSNLIELDPTASYRLRLTALLHDIGKPVTKRFSGKWTFYGHEVVGSDMIKDAVSNLSLSTEDVEYIKKLTALHLRAASLMNDVTDSAVRRLMTDAGDDLMDLMLLSRADITSKNIEKIQRLAIQYNLVYEKYQHIKKVDKLRLFKYPVNGNWIMDNYKLNTPSEITDIKYHLRDLILSNQLDPDNRVEVESAVYDYCITHNIQRNV